ncbi:FAD-dependent monooxygenase [Herbaspirillum sp. YR522]|uniref:FAD-dependent monooxygenase n=1 Tax=Herbaspirillum sp. YR522 TaxID=1144342 RepID=UPI00026F9A53|nr:FAD-dependent monooxygenase [Herbaspirillum sp. YR522]EJM98277.1 Ubiquinone biosynthesis hydroxylase, UbiH/UbiF/VisC/COQ6 family [Herbaspirillum sp. YR522]
MTSHTSPDVDLVICGGGPVGLATAALLAARGAEVSRIALVDQKPAAQAAADPRTIALSYGSRQIIEELGAWQAVGRSATAIEQIHVSRRGHFGRTLLDRRDYQLPALGYVARYGTLNQALDSVVVASGVQLLRPAEVVALEQHHDHVAVQLRDGRSLTAALAIQAEGGVFGQQLQKNMQRDYRQVALIGHVQVDGAIAHRAFERFTDEGPLALLPQDDGYALVWCVSPGSADALQALDDAAFLAALGQAFGQRLGRFTAIGSRHAYPLGLNAGVEPGARVVAIGNAAQTLHPVAGQGLNLGLRDARVLAGLLAHDHAPQALRTFAQRRRSDRRLTVGLTDTMARVFASAPQGSLIQAALGFSLGMIDLVSPARDLLAQQMMFGRR